MTYIPPNSPWLVPKNTELLKQWWEVEGLSAAQISKKFDELGLRITKNSIIGRVHRTKLVPPEGKRKVQAEAKKQRYAVLRQVRAAMEEGIVKPAPIRRVRTPPHPIPTYIVIRSKQKQMESTMSPPVSSDASKAVTLRDAKDGQCRAIIGYKDGLKENAIYCGEATVPTIRYGREVPSSWCLKHKSLYTMESKR